MSSIIILPFRGNLPIIRQQRHDTEGVRRELLIFGYADSLSGYTDTSSKRRDSLFEYADSHSAYPLARKRNVFIDIQFNLLSLPCLVVVAERLAEDIIVGLIEDERFQIGLFEMKDGFFLFSPSGPSMGSSIVQSMVACAASGDLPGSSIFWAVFGVSS